MRPPALMAESRTGGSTALDAVDAWTSPGQGTSPKNRRSYTLKAFAELGIEDAS
jgi:hypothetical protein